MINTTLFCIWLIPAEPYYAALANKIQELSVAYEAPVFAPHVTLFCGKTKNIAQTKSDLTNLLTWQAPLVLTATVMDFTDEYYKTLFLQFEVDEVASGINAALKKRLDQDSSYQFSPHLSLLYKNLPTTEKRKLSRVTEDALNESVMTNKKMTFDQIMLVSDTAEKGPEAVKSWKILAKWNLQGKGIKS